MATSTEQQRKGSSGFSITDVVTNAIEPGVNSSVLMFVNIVFLLLLLTLILIIAFSTGYKLYMILLVMLAFGLFIGFNKFVAMVMEGEQNQNSKQEETISNADDKSDQTAEKDLKVKKEE